MQFAVVQTAAPSTYILLGHLKRMKQRSLHHRQLGKRPS
jgi:hypothetical protein